MEVISLDSVEWWGPKSFSEVAAYESRMVFIRMPRSKTVECLLETFLQSIRLLPLGWMLHFSLMGCLFVLPGRSQVVLRNMIVGRAISLYFRGLLLSRDDDVTSVPADVYDVAKFSCREVTVVG